MNKFIFQVLCFLTLALSYIVVFSTGKSQAATLHSFPGVAPFTTPSGRFGLFEQGTGKIFVYDDNISECVFIGQLSALGEPIEKLK
jgi:hypothetical protein